MNNDWWTIYFQRPYYIGLRTKNNCYICICIGFSEMNAEKDKNVSLWLMIFMWFEKFLRLSRLLSLLRLLNCWGRFWRLLLKFCRLLILSRSFMLLILLILFILFRLWRLFGFYMLEIIELAKMLEIVDIVKIWDIQEIILFQYVNQSVTVIPFQIGSFVAFLS